MSTTLLITLLLAALALSVAIALLLRARRAAPVLPLLAGPPVVLVHGICGFDQLSVLGWRHFYFRGVAAHLDRAGVPVYAARLSPLGSVPARAAQLAALVRSLPHERVTIIAHSMGGLDARYAIATLGLHDRVAELVTVGTPHHGTPLAELAALRPLAAARRMAGKLGLCTDALDWLTPSAMKRFNQQVRDVPGIIYSSVVGSPTLGRMWRNPLLLCGYLYLRLRGGSSDGIVPCASQRWGTRVLEVPVHHFGQVGWSLRGRAGHLYERLLRGDDAAAVARLQLPSASISRPPTAPP